MSSQIDDLTLLIHFVEGDVVLASNYQLYIQPAQELCQLFTRRGQLIAWADHRYTPARIGVRPFGEYSDLLREVLLQHEFMPVGLNSAKQFMEYEYHPVPKGHELNFTQAHDLWKYWWANRKRLVGSQKELEILAFTNRAWAVVNNVVFQTKTLFVTTELGEIALQSEDSLAWIQPQDPQADDDKTVFYSSHAPTPVTEQPHAWPIGQLPRVPTRFSQPKTPSIQYLQTEDAAAERLGCVQRCSDNKLIIDTPHGKVVVIGDRLNFFFESAETMLHSQRLA